MTIYLTDGLPSPREAMRQAVEHAQLAEWEGARMWLDIARELRHGEAPPARPRPRPLDAGNEGPPEVVIPARVTHYGDDYLLPICEEVTGKDPEGCLVSFNREHVTCAKCWDVLRERLAKERRLAAEADLATAGLMPAERRAEAVEEAREQVRMDRAAEERGAAYADASWADVDLRAYAGEQASPRFAPVHVPVEQPAYRTADTEIIRFDPPGEAAAPTCGHCGHVIRFARMSDDHPDPVWYHDMTAQRVCPVSKPDQQHTFATPSVDARG